MATEVRADTGQLAELGFECITVGRALRGMLKTLREDALVPATAFGNSTGVQHISEAYSDVLEDAGTALEDLAEVIEGDSDRIFGVAFAYQAEDERSGDQINRHEPPAHPSSSPPHP